MGREKSKENALLSSFAKWKENELEKATIKEIDMYKNVEMSEENGGEPVTTIVRKMGKISRRLAKSNVLVPEQALQDYAINEKGDLVKVIKVVP